MMTVKQMARMGGHARARALSAARRREIAAMGTPARMRKAVRKAGRVAAAVPSDSANNSGKKSRRRTGTENPVVDSEGVKPS